MCMDWDTPRPFVGLSTKRGNPVINSGYLVWDVAHKTEADGILVRRCWDKIFRPFLGDMPTLVGTQISATFLVKKERILARPYKAWVIWRDWAATAGSGPEPEHVFEYLWHFVLGEPAFCPNITASEILKC